MYICLLCKSAVYPCRNYIKFLKKVLYLNILSFYSAKLFQISDTRNYYTIDTDDLDVDDLDTVGNHGNQTLQFSSQQSLHDIVTRIPSENCEIRDISKEEISEYPEQYSNMAFTRRMSSTPSFHNNLYPCADDDNCISASPSKAPSRKTSEQRMSSSSDEVFTTCKSCSHLLCPDLTEDRPGMVQCQECGTLNIRLSPLDIHVTERTDSAICSTASDDSDHSHGTKSDSSTNSEEYLMPESPGVPMATGARSANHNEKSINTNSFDFSDVTFHSKFDNLPDSNVSEMPMPLTFCSSKTSDYYYVLRHHMESVLLKRQLSGGEHWAIANTKL